MYVYDHFYFRKAHDKNNRPVHRAGRFDLQHTAFCPQTGSEMPQRCFEHFRTEELKGFNNPFFNRFLSKNDTEKARRDGTPLRCGGYSGAECHFSMTETG